MSIFENLNPLRLIASNSGRNDAKKMTYWTTPWAWRDDDGCYVGHNGDVWLYRTLQVAPLLWEDPKTRLQVESPLATLLYELGATAKDLGVGMRSLSKSREIHLLAISWETEARPPEGTPPALQEYMESVLQFVVPSKVLLIGVKLRSSTSGSATSLVDRVTSKAGKQLGTRGPDLERYEADRKIVAEILRRNGAPAAPDREARNQLESWYNLGRGTDATVLATPDMLFVDEQDRIEMAAVVRFDNPEMEAPYAQWAMAAQIHPAGASVISVRGEIEPSSVSRNRIRRSQRKVIAQMEEEAATGDIERPEQAMTYSLAQKVERFILTGREPLITNCSIVMARRVGPEANETYIDELRNAYHLEVKPLAHRQMATLEETLPTGVTRVNPFLQDVSVSMLAYAGLPSFSNLGDRTGVYIGLVDPDYVPCYLDPLGAPAANRPPAMLIAGDPGSGKAMPLSHRILTPAGWTTMGELEVGSEVIGRDGKAHVVTAIYPQGELDIYRITFSDGSWAECCADHLWAVRRPNDASRGKGWRTMALHEIMASGLRDDAGRAVWEIPLVDAVEFSTSTDSLAGAAYGAGYNATGDGIGGSWLRATVQQRIEVLQGVLDRYADVDGGEVVAALPSARIAGDVMELVQLLGGTATTLQVTDDVTQIQVRVPGGITPFHLEAKRARWSAGNHAAPARTIASIERVGRDEAQCITVDADDSLYVADQGVVTHNTFLGQSICLQSALAGVQTIVINPKSDDSLEGLAELAGGTTIKLSQIEAEGGFFDPFRFCTPDATGRQIAADILGQHILSVLGARGVSGSGFTQEQEISVIAGLRAGADAGAECAAQAISRIEDDAVKKLILQQATDPLFRLAIGMTPKPNISADRRLLLIEFDKPLDIPEKGTEPAQYSRPNRLAIAAVRLVTRASMEILANSLGGVMFLDEAWMFLQSSEGLAAMQSFGRLGRSKNILPIFATQRVDDLVREDVGMEGYLSRVFVMKLAEEREARAGLKLLGLEGTPDRVAWLANAGPRQGENGQPARGAMALHRDLKNRHSALLVGPVSEYVRLALSTNPEDRARRRAEAAARAAAERSES